MSKLLWVLTMMSDEGDGEVVMMFGSDDWITTGPMIKEGYGGDVGDTSRGRRQVQVQKVGLVNIVKTRSTLGSYDICCVSYVPGIDAVSTARRSCQRRNKGPEISQAHGINMPSSMDLWLWGFYTMRQRASAVVGRCSRRLYCHCFHGSVVVGYFCDEAMLLCRFIGSSICFLNPLGFYIHVTIRLLPPPLASGSSVLRVVGGSNYVHRKLLLCIALPRFSCWMQPVKRRHGPYSSLEAGCSSQLEQVLHLPLNWLHQIISGFSGDDDGTSGYLSRYGGGGDIVTDQINVSQQYYEHSTEDQERPV
ncbi:hypothetical protein M8C21_028346 [Ambrosia artemisiifolia]|uniref:Uncharacterized protein n=1 Tax=Ambrosia artemisiifolia TaxID=4212 RepID=A0AAD5CYM7_AMBAR|nr:hypothetical protein M8C21_028346 [Ambrosia artemisiifolia]